MRLAIISSHPIQYNAPLFKLLTQRGKLNVKVFYTWGKQSIEPKFDPGFGKTIKWDIPLLDGYDYEFLENVSKAPGSSHFKGIINPDIIQKIKSYQPTAVLVYGWAFKSHLKVLRYFHNRIPVLFRGDSTLLNDAGGLKQQLRKLFLTWVYSKVNYALYVGTNNKKYYETFGLNNRQLVFAPHCVDSSRFSATDNAQQSMVISLQRQLNISSNDFVFLYAGKLETVKNVGLLLQAFTKANFGSDVKLVIVGNGPLESEMKMQFEENSSISFLPFQNQQAMPAIYKLAHYYILPSKSETWGLAINEAMACGKPAIASNRVGCAVDLVENGKTGFTFQSGEEASLITALQAAYSNKNSYAMFSENAIAKSKEFSLEKVAEAIENTIQQFNSI